MNAEPLRPGDEPEDWSEVAAGLSTMATALMWRLGIAAGAASLLILAVMERSHSLLKFVSLVAPLGTMLATIALLIGMHRFSKQPAVSAGRGLASFAAIEMAISLALDGYAYLKVLQIHSADMSNWRAVRHAQEAAETAQTASMWAMGLGFCSMFVLLGSLTAVSKHIRRPDVGEAIFNVGCVLVLAAGVVLGFRWYVNADSSSFTTGSLFGLGAGMLAIAATAVLMYAAAMRSLGQALRDHGVLPAELPEARLIERG